MKPLRITKEQILTIERKVSRDLEIESGNRINYKRVWKSKKTYTRKGKKDWD
jgi:hypothetical protein